MFTVQPIKHGVLYYRSGKKQKKNNWEGRMTTTSASKTKFSLNKVPIMICMFFFVTLSKIYAIITQLSTIIRKVI